MRSYLFFPFVPAARVGRPYNSTLVDRLVTQPPSVPDLRRLFFSPPAVLGELFHGSSLVWRYWSARDLLHFTASSPVLSEHDLPFRLCSDVRPPPPCFSNIAHSSAKDRGSPLVRRQYVGSGRVRSFLAPPANVLAFVRLIPVRLTFFSATDLRHQGNDSDPSPRLVLLAQCTSLDCIFFFTVPLVIVFSAPVHRIARLVSRRPASNFTSFSPGTRFPRTPFTYELNCRLFPSCSTLVFFATPRLHQALGAPWSTP